MSELISKISNIFFGSFDETALLQGTSDIIVVQWDTGHYHATPFIVCFGASAITSKHKVRVYVNKILLSNVHFNLDQYGYLHPMRPNQQFIRKLCLKNGRNCITFQLENRHSISCQIYLYKEDDKLLVSDMDGTLTKDDLGGLYNNYHGQNYLHEGYYELIQALNKKRIKIVWLTMRSLPLYSFSKNYIERHTQIHGPLITQPEQLLTAVKKQILKKAGRVKTNMLKSIKDLFPQNRNPFIGGLGNRQNDAIAYRAVGIPLSNIFIIDTASQVYQFRDQKIISYHNMSQNLEEYFLMNELQMKKHQSQSEYQKITSKISQSLKSKLSQSI